MSKKEKSRSECTTQILREILRIVAANYGVEKNTVGNWRRNHANLGRFASNACGAMTNRKAMNLAEYDKIG